MKKHTLATTIVATASALALSLAPLAPASAATSAWGVWSEVAPSVTPSANLTFAGTGMVNANYTVNGAGSQTVIGVAGGDEYFVAGTPIGSVFGANGPTGDNNYLRTESENDTVTPVVITVTFDSAVEAGLLGFAVSDLDSDHVTVTATGATGSALTGTELVGSATDGAFNFCNYTDSPCSDTAVPTITVNANDVLATGVDANSDGSTAWFRPSVAVKTVTFTYLNDDNTNVSSTRYWFAQTAAALPDTGVSSSTVIILMVVGASLLAAGGLMVARRRS
jgi:LPXTG-motif cell wall-anchored protein